MVRSTLPDGRYKEHIVMNTPSNRQTVSVCSWPCILTELCTNELCIWKDTPSLATALRNITMFKMVSVSFLAHYLLLNMCHYMCNLSNPGAFSNPTSDIRLCRPPDNCHSGHIRPELKFLCWQWSKWGKW